ncbi:UDP-glucuronosyltransferase 1-9 [Drosophila innubila]|uniref:UDP-glucuronosyltransferase 1-9 n=1 Tax=Drosophila innubila TaxID=198719 RepID=UPI00148BF053|nr:UDP-glucuronosyltransferase 1-9 [Drosophila innubila]
MKIFVTVLLLLLSCIQWQQLHAAKILCIVGTAAHNNPSWTQPFFEALAGRGHSLTIVGTSPDPEIKGITHVQIENKYDVIKKQYVDTLGNFKQYWDLKQMLIWYEALLGNCRSVLEDNLVVDELKANYDLIIYDATYSMDCLMNRLPKYRDTPVLALSSGKLTVDLLNLMHAEDTINPARIPHFISQLPVEMNYWQRILNHVLYIGEAFIRWGVVKPVLNGMLRDGFRNPDVQLMLLNTHPVLDYVQNLPPNVVEVGGLHIRAESAPLPLNLQEFVNRFPEGIIYINLPQLQLISSEGVKAIQYMIKDFSQFGFIWNVKDVQLFRSYHNLRTISVDLQQDILAKSSMKAFLTHGDSFGLQEAIYNAIPVIVLPLLMDQINNAKRVEERYLGVRLSTDNITSHSFSDALKRIVREEIFLDNLHEAQVNFRTRQVKPLNQAVWYAEQLVSEPQLYKHLSHPQSREQSYFVSHSFDFLILPVLFVAFFIGNIVMIIVQVTKSQTPKTKAKLSAKKSLDKIKVKDNGKEKDRGKENEKLKQPAKEKKEA